MANGIARTYVDALDRERFRRSSCTLALLLTVNMTSATMSPIWTHGALSPGLGRAWLQGSESSRWVMTTLIILFVVTVQSAAPNLNGRWNLEMVWGPESTVSTTVCTVTHTDAKLSGTCGAKSTLTGEVQRRSLTFQIDVEQDGRKGRMTFEGALEESDAAVRGTCSVVNGPTGTFTMKKE